VSEESSLELSYRLLGASREPSPSTEKDGALRSFQIPEEDNIDIDDVLLIETHEAEAVDHRRALDYDRLLLIGRQLLIALGEDPDSEGVRGTPRRFANWWREFIEHDAGQLDTTFEIGHHDQTVVVSGLRVWSICQHHLLPFRCELAIGYKPIGRVLGLSKIARLANKHARQLQLQERLCDGIAEDLARLSGSSDVAVAARGEHLCMAMRGVRAPATVTSTTMHGIFRSDRGAREEFLRLISPCAHTGQF